MSLIRKLGEGELTQSQARTRLRRIDRSMWLEFNSSWLNYFLLDLLVEEFEDAKFILTIRDCYSWLDSIFNQLLGRDHEDYALAFHKWYGDSMTSETHPSEEQVLKDQGLWPLGTWLRVWRDHNQRVLERAPKARLLIVRTADIRGEIPRMADFLGVSPASLNSERSHEFKAAQKFNILEKLDQAYLDMKVREHCGALMDTYFPEMTGLDRSPVRTRS